MLICVFLKIQIQLLSNLVKRANKLLKRYGMSNDKLAYMPTIAIETKVCLLVI